MGESDGWNFGLIGGPNGSGDVDGSRGESGGERTGDGVRERPGSVGDEADAR
jgi:hypothetical protein